MTTNKKRKRPGPNPGMLKIDDNWKVAINKALKKKRPPEGWPKPAKDK